MLLREGPNLPTLERSRISGADSKSIFDRLEKLESALAASEKRADSFEKKFLSAQKKIERLESNLGKVEAENRRLRDKRSGNEEILRKEIHKLELKVSSLTEKLEAANKSLAWFRRKTFDRSSEQGDADQEGAAADKEATGEAKTKRAKGQPRGSKGHGRSDRSEVETKIEYLEIPGGCTCDSCGTQFRLLPKTEASPLTEYEASVVRTIFQRCIYVSQCKCKGKKIVVAPPPPKLYPRSEIGNSLWVHLFVQKFLHGMPTNRILKDLSLYGLHLAEGTVTGGSKIINDLVAPLWENIADHCRGANIWNADETSWRVFGEDKQKWWFWLIASQDAVVYILDPSRSKQVPVDFFAGSVGILMTDKYSSYKALHAGIQKAWCLVHLRRDILNIYKGVPNLKAWSKAWLLRIAKLFILNQNRFKLFLQDEMSGEKWDEADSELRKYVRDLRKCWEAELRKPHLHKQQSKILRSMKRHWPGYTLFLDDPRIPLHNNRAERLLRNPVILRKSSFGSGAPWAGELAARIFSIFQTWLINGLDPKALLLDYFNECSKSPGKPPPNIEEFMPWTMSAERRGKFALPESYQRPG